MLNRLRYILTYSPASLGRLERFLLFQGKMWIHCARLLHKNLAGQQAAALAYHSLFGLVPLVIVMLLGFQVMPGYQQTGQKLREMAYRELSLTEIKIPIQHSDSETDAETETVLLTKYLEDFIHQFFAGLDKGSIGLLGAVLVIWAALNLLTTTERAFNRIWYVNKGRSWVSRILNYWGLLTLGPLLLGLGIHLASSHALVGRLERVMQPQVWPVFLSYGVAVVAFFLLYFMLPNAYVRVWPALWGAVVAALVWSMAKWGFGQYVIRFIPYSKVYGVIGLIPLTVFWIHATWLMVLFGLQLTFTTQHMKRLDAAEMASAQGQEGYFLANDLTVIHLLREVANAFETHQAPISAEAISRHLDLPPALGQKILDHLTESGLVVRTCEPVEGYMPACAPEQITLADITAVMARVSFCQNLPPSAALDAFLDSQRLQLTQLNLKQLLQTNASGTLEDADNESGEGGDGRGVTRG